MRVSNDPSGADDPAALLREIETVQNQTRGVLRSCWFPLAVFGSLMLASAPLALVGDGVASAVFWVVAGPAGAVAVGRYYRKREVRIGLSRAPGPYIVTTVAMMAGAFVLPAFTHGDLQGVVSNFAIAAGYVAFAVLDRDPRLAWLGVALAAVPIAFLATVPSMAASGSAAVLGATLLGCGIVFRRRELQPA